jgi:hypothetical protein
VHLSGPASSSRRASDYFAVGRVLDIVIYIITLRKSCTGFQEISYDRRSQTISSSSTSSDEVS